MTVKSIWSIDQDHTVHFGNCDEIKPGATPYMTTTSKVSPEGVPYFAIVKTATEMVEHLARPDTKDKMPGRTIAVACQCVTLTATREVK